jgi:hypothetical protein
MVSRVLIGILLLIIYIMIFIPYILPSINGMFMDWINNNPTMFQQQWCSIHEVFNETSNSFYNYTDCKTMDLRPPIVFIWEITIYFIIPTSLVLITMKSK